MYIQDRDGTIPKERENKREEEHLGAKIALHFFFLHIDPRWKYIHSLHTKFIKGITERYRADKTRVHNKRNS